MCFHDVISRQLLTQTWAEQFVSKGHASSYHGKDGASPIPDGDISMLAGLDANNDAVQPLFDYKTTRRTRMQGVQAVWNHVLHLVKHRWMAGGGSVGEDIARANLEWLV
jgi:hypothetical protein